MFLPDFSTYALAGCPFSGMRRTSARIEAGVAGGHA